MSIRTYAKDGLHPLDSLADSHKLRAMILNKWKSDPWADPEKVKQIEINFIQYPNGDHPDYKPHWALRSNIVSLGLLTRGWHK